MSTAVTGPAPVPIPRATPLRRDPAAQAFLLLRIVFTVAPILFGLDKFAEVLTDDWTAYLATAVQRHPPRAARATRCTSSASSRSSPASSWPRAALRRAARRRLARRDHRQPPAGRRLRRHRAARLRAAGRRPGAVAAGQRRLRSGGAAPALHPSLLWKRMRIRALFTAIVAAAALAVVAVTGTTAPASGAVVPGVQGNGPVGEALEPLLPDARSASERQLPHLRPGHHHLHPGPEGLQVAPQGGRHRGPGRPHQGRTAVRPRRRSGLTAADR